MWCHVALFIFACVFVGTGLAQFTCTQQASFSTPMDGTFTTVTCSNGGNLGPRCPGCCESWAMSRGGSKTNSAGFINQGGNGCVCCMQGGVQAAIACQGPGCNFRTGHGIVVLP